MSVCLGHVRAEDGAAAAVLPVVERREPEPPLQVERRRARECEKLAERHRPACVSWVARGDARPSACVVVVALEYVEPCIEARSRLHPSCRDSKGERVPCVHGSNASSNGRKKHSDPCGVRISPHKKRQTEKQALASHHSKAPAACLSSHRFQEQRHAHPRIPHLRPRRPRPHRTQPRP